MGPGSAVNKSESISLDKKEIVYLFFNMGLLKNGKGIDS
jgi:hypothetical protein